MTTVCARASRRPGPPPAAERWTLAVLTVAAAVIRLPTLGAQSFWLDEAYTVRLMRMGFVPMLRGVARSESTPPLYYVLAWAWTHLFGLTEVGLRSLSALAGIATVPVVVAAGRRLADRRVGAIAGLLVAVAPLMVWFSQEARSYALACLLAAVTLLCLAGWRQDGARGWLVGWTVAAALGLATHYFVVFVVAVEVAWLAWDARGRRRERRPVASAAGTVALVGLLLAPLALAQRGTGHADYIAQGSLGARIAQIPKQLLIGYASPGQLATGVIAGALLIAGAGFALARHRAVRQRAAVTLTIGVGAIAVPIVLAVIGIDFLNTRNLLVALPALTVAAAVGFAGTGPRRAGIACAVALAAVELTVVVLVDANARYQREDWRAISRALGDAPGPAGRAIIVSPASGAIALRAYRPALRSLSAPTPVTEVDVIGIPAAASEGGLGTPPRPLSPVPVPAGFRLVAIDDAPTYTVLRYRAPAPVTVAPTLDDVLYLGGGDHTMLRGDR